MPAPSAAMLSAVVAIMAKKTRRMVRNSMTLKRRICCKINHYDEYMTTYFPL